MRAKISLWLSERENVRLDPVILLTYKFCPFSMLVFIPLHEERQTCTLINSAGGKNVIKDSKKGGIKHDICNNQTKGIKDPITCANLVWPPGPLTPGPLTPWAERKWRAHLADGDRSACFKKNTCQSLSRGPPHGHEPWEPTQRT